MKIIKSKKYKIIESERRDPIEEVPDPYSINFNREEEKARGMSTSSLFIALQDAIEASQLSPNSGKYFDQASVYRMELQNRKISIPEQDEKLKTIPSQHPKQQYEPFGHNPQDIKDIPSPHTNRVDSVKKTHGIWKDLSEDELKDLMQDDRHMA